MLVHVIYIYISISPTPVTDNVTEDYVIAILTIVSTGFCSVDNHKKCIDFLEFTFLISEVSYHFSDDFIRNNKTNHISYSNFESLVKVSTHVY